MNYKTFLVQFEYDERTRWCEDDSGIQAIVKTLADSAGQLSTEGPVPAVMVMTVETSLLPAGLRAFLERGK